MHANQLSVPAEMVRALVDEQFPQWRRLPVRSLAASGTVNAIFRIGERLAAPGGSASGRPDPLWILYAPGTCSSQGRGTFSATTSA